MSADWNPTDALSFRLAGRLRRGQLPAKHGHREARASASLPASQVLDDIYDTRAGVGDDNLVRNQGVSLTAAWELRTRSRSSRSRLTATARRIR